MENGATDTPETMDRRVRKLLDQAELRELIDAYATTADSRDGAGFAALFAPGATLQVVEASGSELPPFSGDEIAEGLAPLAQYERTHHLMANHTWTADGDAGTGAVYCLARHLRKLEDGSLEDLLMVIRYEDSYSRTARGWKFGTRICRILWMEVHPAALDLTAF